ncbi:MAG: hypothetical protein IH607_03310, partial [Firmicutes bacterium]|nr:hypothetical protein [Bacillota bacterium]
MWNEHWQQTVRILHFAIRLPIRLYHQDALVLALPETRDPAWALLSCGSVPTTWPAERQSATTQYIQGRTSERYVCQFIGDDYALCIGPFCTETIHDKDLNRQLRIYFASVKDREL